MNKLEEMIIFFEKKTRRRGKYFYDRVNKK